MLARLLITMLGVMPRPIIRRVAGRYIAGDNKEDAIALAAQLNRDGFAVTIDHLGEDVTQADQARRELDAYGELMAAMTAAGVDRNISIKLTQLGLRQDPGLAFALFEKLLAAAGADDFFVRIDMEDSSVTDATLDFYERGRAIWPRIGTVLQARLRRTAEDAARLAQAGASFRLCKGIYLEPPELAYQDPGRINAAYMDVLRILLDAGAHVAIATHDAQLIAQSRFLVKTHPGAMGRHEFQALLGVPIRNTLESLRREGHVVRIYLPFGQDWYAYSLRRLRENPRIAVQIAGSLFRRDHL